MRDANNIWDSRVVSVICDFKIIKLMDTRFNKKNEREEKRKKEKDFKDTLKLQWWHHQYR